MAVLKYKDENGVYHDIVGINVQCEPDNEDLHYNSSNQLQFKDRPNTSGMGKVILRKNMVSGVNTLIQSMMQATNTIYVIQYNFTLGEDITVPANSVLEFDGGSINGNGTGKNTITGNNTSITSNTNSILKDLLFSGSFNQSYILVDWFGYDSDSDKIQNAIIASRTIEAIVLFCGRTYTIDKTINLDSALDHRLYLKGINNKTFLSCSLDIPIFQGNNTFETIEDIWFQGNSRGTGSYAFFMSGGYIASIKHCFFSNFDIALHVGFVELNIEDCYITGNNIAIAICKRTSISTCLNIESCTFVDNYTCCITDNLYPDDIESATNNNVGTCIKLKISDSIFEQNNQAFEIAHAQLKLIYNCWFERNHVASKIIDYSLVEYNNAFQNEPSWTNFDLPAASYGYGFGGSVRLGIGTAKAKRFDLSCYDDNYKAIDNGQYSIFERILDSNHYISVSNKSTNKSAVINSSDIVGSNSRVVANRIYLYVKDDGTVVFNTNNSIVTGVTYDSVNKYYRISLSGVIKSPSITITPNNSTTFLTYYLDRGDTTDWATGMSSDRSDHIRVKFKNEQGDIVAANFGMLIEYSL